MHDFELVFDSLPVPAWVFSLRDLRFLAVNNAAIEQYGYSRDEFLSMTIAQIGPPQDVERLKEFLDARNRESQPWRHVRKDGSHIDVEVSITTTSFMGQPANVVVARNITGQSYVLDRLAIALDAAKIGVWEYDIASGALQWDLSYSGVYGLSRASFPKTADEFLLMVDPDHREAVGNAFHRCVQDGVPYDCDFQMLLPDGVKRWRHACGRRVSDPRGTPVKVIGVGIDITQQRLLEIEVNRSKRFEAIGRLASGIAHDFNNILTVIKGYSHLLNFNATPEIVEVGSREIEVASDRAAKLVKQLFDFSRTKPAAPVRVNINSMVEDVAGLVKGLLPESIKLRLELSEHSLEVLADQGQVEQMVMNLCLNARDAMQSGGEIVLRTGVVDDQPDRLAVQLKVTDTGCGMTPSIQEHIFEPFFTTKEVGKGTGLGLSIVQGLVTQLGGRIDVTSFPNHGSTFTVHLPALSAT